jgi:Pyruvate/2-oxoacid:ferredoxin oxidoreductase delta subunit
VYLANVGFGQERFPLIPGNFYAEVTASRCVQCEACVASCPWGARSVTGGVPAVDLARCFGCGLCARVCESGATAMRLKDGRLPFRSDREGPRSGAWFGPARGHFAGDSR